MARITRRGRQLHNTLCPYLPEHHDWMGVQETCSLIGRLAVTHDQLSVLDCNRTLREDERHKLDVHLPRRLAELVAMLPETPHGPLDLVLGGDPRGFTVKLALPVRYPDRQYLGNTWGRDGLFGVATTPSSELSKGAW